MENVFKDVENDLEKKGVTFSFGEEGSTVITDWISTGVWVLDKILGGGVPVGRIVEIFGPTATGKSSLGFSILGSAQSQRYLTLLIDTEASYDSERAKLFGLDSKKLFKAEIDTIEDVFYTLIKVIEKVKKVNKRLVIVWDSLAATTTEKELEGDLGDKYYGIHANLISQAFRKYRRLLFWEGCTLVLLNQVREAMGEVFGPRYTTFGGLAPQFYSSIRVELQEREKIKNEKGIVEQVRIQARTVKNKVFPPYRGCYFYLDFKKGFDNIKSSLEYLVENGVIKNKSGWYEYKDKKYRESDLISYFSNNQKELKQLFDGVEL